MSKSVRSTNSPLSPTRANRKSALTGDSSEPRTGAEWSTRIRRGERARVAEKLGQLVDDRIDMLGERASRDGVVEVADEVSRRCGVVQESLEGGPAAQLRDPCRAVRREPVAPAGMDGPQADRGDDAPRPRGGQSPPRDPKGHPGGGRERERSGRAHHRDARGAWQPCGSSTDACGRMSCDSS